MAKSNEGIMDSDKNNDVLNDIKKLMVLQLLAAGVQQSTIAAMLGISEATMSRSLPRGLSASLRKERVQ